MSRRRRAPIARETSDVTRFRGVWLAGIVAGVAALTAVGIGSGGIGLVAPGPLARPHASAALGCQSCHGQRDIASSCTGCHGPHASARPGHERLRAAGKLGCASCHAVHTAEDGLSFLSSGEVVAYGSGYDTRLDVTTGFRSPVTLHVPLIRAGACAACHDARDARDPAFACLGPGPFALCFDEHGGEAQASRRSEPGRVAAAEAAREIVASAPPALFSPRSTVSLAPLAAALCGALLVLALRRPRLASWIARLRGGAEGPPAPPPNAPLRRLPVIDAARCLGCSACVDVCPYDVLEIKNYVAVVARPEDCCGLVSCQERCPNGSLVVQAGPPVEDRPALGEGLEVLDNPGLHLAGDVTGLPLIRVALEQGTRAARAAAERIRARGGRGADADADLLVVGTGPAGLAAALEAKRLGLKVIALEQGRIAESIQSFPRGKLILDRPVDEGARLPLWLGECTKEELVERWLRAVRHARLTVREGERVIDVRRRSNGDSEALFEVTATNGVHTSTLTARRVVLAIGRRGTPRKLPVSIPASMQNRVYYSLSDAAQFGGRRVLVVGLGDSAMEAAQALAHQAGTVVTVSYRGSDFRRGKPRNIDAVRRLAAEGRIDLAFESEVSRLGDGEVVLQTHRGPRVVRADAVFVMIGSISGSPLLDAIGWTLISERS